jgi:hypothetical protein
MLGLADFEGMHVPAIKSASAQLQLAANPREF